MNPDLDTPNLAAWHLDAFCQQGLMVTDRDLVIRYWNPWLESHTGRPASEMVGWPLLGRFPDLAERKLDRAYQRALDGQTAVLSQRFHQYLLPMPTRVGTVTVAQMRQSARIVPLARDGQIAGTVTVIEDVTERVQREEELLRQISLQEALTEISRAILTLDLKDCLRRIVTEAAALLGAELVAVVFQQGETYRVGASTLPLATVDGQLDPRSVAAWVSRSRQAFRVEDLQAVIGSEVTPPLGARSRSLVAVPLVSGEEIIGALVAESERVRAFGAAEQAVLVVFSQHVALAIHNARLFAAQAESETRFRAVAQTATDAIITLDEQGLVLLWNLAAETQFGYPAAEVIGLPVTRIMPERFRQAHETSRRAAVAAGTAKLAGKTVELTGRRKDGTEFPLELSLAEWQADGRIYFTSIIRDITARKAAEAERERMIADLQKALAEVKTLQGIIPICAGCKKIRDDQGYWNQVETYVASRTQAQFSHGMCPDCLKKWYPEIADEKTAT